MGLSLQGFKAQLARALDDDLHTRQWHNIVDWLIIGMILLSAVEIFLSTFDFPSPIRKALDAVNIITLLFFTVEVSLRIWVAPLVNPKWKGWKGRLRYCLSFHGLIDILSTYPFYIQWLIPLPTSSLKILRTVRVVRIFRLSRYSKSFSLLASVMREKKRELLVAVQFLTIITLILSLILFFAEHQAQPEVYKNGFISVIWAFAQYIGDPGQFADTPPITGLGRVIACIVGVLGIAIVAVPAGILGAGFTEALEKEAKKNANQTLHAAFQRKLDRPTGLQTVPPFITMPQLQAITGLNTNEIINAVKSATPPFFRLFNTASTIPVAEKPADMLAVEHYVTNRSYGLCIDRGSRVTIISPSSYIDAGVGNFAFYLALIGGFNYISREMGDRIQASSYYSPSDEVQNTDPAFGDYVADLRGLMGRPDAWSFTILVASGALEPTLPTHLHFATGGKKGEGLEVESVNTLVKDKATYVKLFNRISADVHRHFGLETDHQRYYDTSGKKLFLRRFSLDYADNVILRIEWNKLLWHPDRIGLCRILAGDIKDVLEGRLLDENPILKVKNKGFDDYLEKSNV